MSKKIKCKVCEKEYDINYDECPKCHTKNEEQPRDFKHNTVLHFGKQIALFITGWLGFQLIALLIEIVMIRTNNITTNQALNEFFSKNVNNMILNAAAYGVLLLILLIIINIDIKKLAKSFAQWKGYIAALIGLGVIFAFNIIYNSILNAAGVRITSNNNQQALDTNNATFPITSLLIFGIVGPICEELTYRVGLFSLSKRISKWVAYPVTIVVFALIHFDFQASNMVNEWINIPYYAVAAFTLSFVYDKYGFSSSCVLHIANNIISLTLIRCIQ